MHNIVTDLIKALPGSSSVNTVHYAITEAVSQWTNVYSSLLGDSVPMDWRVTYHVTRFFYGLPCATIELWFLCGPCRGYITELWAASSEQIGTSSEWQSDTEFWVLGRRQPREVRIWRRVNLWIEDYVCYSAVGLGVCNLVRLLQFPCYKSVARKHTVKTSGNRLRRLVWSDCKLCKSARV
jgi:hypothetical protein